MPSRSRERAWGTLRARLTLWNTAVVLAMTVAALLGARFAARATLYDNADEELRSGVKEVVLALRDQFPDMEAVVAEMRRKAASHEARGWFIQLLTEEGSQVWKSRYCPDAVANFPPTRLDHPENVVQVGPYRYVRLRIDQPGRPSFHVRVGTYTTGLDARLSALMRVLFGVGAILCALTPLAGWWLAVRSTRPVAAILDTADRLEPSRLGDRLPVRGTGDELDHLARTINGLLDDVAAHVDRQQQFVADAAHELRGPLAAMRSTLEVALSNDRSGPDYRAALEDVLEESRYLSTLANGLLLLAETAADTVPVATSTVDLTTLTRQAVAMFSGVAEDRGVMLRAVCPDGDALVAGDTGQLRQVVGNLLDNAIRFTRPGGSVEVVVRHEPRDHLVTLAVSDSGAGIADRHIPRLFDRFYKVDPARSRQGESRTGGLGLPICKAIVDRHGGTIEVASREGRGTTVTVRMPAAPRSDEQFQGVAGRSADSAASPTASSA